jgi:hypothetical protein
MTSFSAPTISINENGIDLLRNRFAYQHLKFSEVQNFSIEDGYLLKNRLLVLITGIAMIVLAAKLFVPVLEVYGEVPENISTHSIGRGLAFMQMIPLALIGFGSYFTIQSLRKSKILHLETRTEQFNIRIREIDKAGNLKNLASFLEQKSDNRLIDF